MIWFYALVRFISIASLLIGFVLFEGLHLRLWSKGDRVFNQGVLILSAILIALGLAGLSVVKVW